MGGATLGMRAARNTAVLVDIYAQMRFPVLVAVRWANRLQPRNALNRANVAEPAGPQVILTARSA